MSGLVVSYGKAIRDCKDWRRALGLLEEMRRRDLEPNSVTCTAAAKSCERALRWAHALALDASDAFGAAVRQRAWSAGRRWRQACDELRRAQQKRLRVDGVNLSTAISACKGAWLQAIMLLQAGRAVGLAGVVSHGGVLSVLESRHWQWALDLLRKLQRDKVANSVTCGAALAALAARAARWRRSGELVAEMEVDRLAVDLAGAFASRDGSGRCATAVPSVPLRSVLGGKRQPARWPSPRPRMRSQSVAPSAPVRRPSGAGPYRG
ncbi:unnamed protein product [Effrenium voratum]|nr:unnamed protein product [Effrenium voratum]